MLKILKKSTFTKLNTDLEYWRQTAIKFQTLAKKLQFENNKLVTLMRADTIPENYQNKIDENHKYNLVDKKNFISQNKKSNNSLFGKTYKGAEIRVNKKNVMIIINPPKLSVKTVKSSEKIFSLPSYIIAEKLEIAMKNGKNWISIRELKNYLIQTYKEIGISQTRFYLQKSLKGLKKLNPNLIEVRK